MGWGQVYVNSGAGSTDQIERAHEALDRLKIGPGPLAVRVLALVVRYETRHMPDDEGSGGVW